MHGLLSKTEIRKTAFWAHSNGVVYSILILFYVIMMMYVEE